MTKNPEDDDDEEPFDYLQPGAMNRDYPRSIDSIRKLASKLGYGDQYEIEMGLSGAENMRLAITRGYLDPFAGPIYKAEVTLRKAIAVDYPTKAIMSDFWELLFAEAGHVVPEELIGKPPV